MVEGSGDLDSATTGTWAGKIPASLLPSVPPASAHPPSTTTAAKSPEKSKPTSDGAAIEVCEANRMHDIVIIHVAHFSGKGRQSLDMHSGTYMYTCTVDDHYHLRHARGRISIIICVPVLMNR